MNPNFILIFCCLGLGLFLRLTNKFPAKSHQVLNSFVIWISLPALILMQIPALLQKTAITSELIIPLSMSWILLGLSFLTFYFVGKHFHWSNAKTGALILTAGLGNTSFVGFPILESFFGPEAVRIGVLIDQPGTFLALSTLGLLIASAFSPLEGRQFRLSFALKRVLKFPPFIALLVALACHITGIQTSETAFAVVLERLASTLVPLALVAVGLQLKISANVLQRQWKPLSFGLAFKLVMAPAFFIFLYVFIFSSKSFSTHVTILESAMAPMITASVVAEEFGLDAEIASLMVAVGIPLSLLTVYLWNQLIYIYVI